MAIEFTIPFIPVKIKASKVQPSGKVLNKNYNKVFVIGFNKTGTTSLRRTMMLWGFKIGNQQVASMMVEDYANKRYDRIFRLVETADAFQDVPFSYPLLYKKLDKKFPNSKFILTVRDSKEQWFNSLLNFHSKKAGNKPPKKEDLDRINNIYRGFMLDTKYLVWDYPEVKLYNKQHYTDKYTKHNNDVRHYFKNRPDDFIEINLSNQGDFSRLKKFLNVDTNMSGFPWVKKTKK